MCLHWSGIFCISSHFVFCFFSVCSPVTRIKRRDCVFVWICKHRTFPIRPGFKRVCDQILKLMLWSWFSCQTEQRADGSLTYSDLNRVITESQGWQTTVELNRLRHWVVDSVLNYLELVRIHINRACSGAQASIYVDHQHRVQRICFTLDCFSTRWGNMMRHRCVSAEK